MNVCQIEGCSRAVSKSDHALCLAHWKAERAGEVVRCPKCLRWHAVDSKPHACPPIADLAAGPAVPTAAVNSPRGLLSSTRLGRHFGLSNVKTNLLLAELGWIEKYGEGWAPTDRGNALGANIRHDKRAPFVVWPEAILINTALLESASELTTGTRRPRAIEVDPTPPAAPVTTGRGTPRPVSLPAPRHGSPSTATRGTQTTDDFRDKFEAPYITMDGHRVRSRAEVIIDNWLYMQNIAHAYERRLPIEEDCYCDFYLPAGKVYIEYWGRERDPKYRARKAIKQAIYAKYGLRLIELGDAEIEKLDDVLPKMLATHRIEIM